MACRSTSTVATWATKNGVSAQEATVWGYIPGATHEGGAVYLGGSMCAPSTASACAAVVLNATNQTTDRASCESTAADSQDLTNGVRKLTFLSIQLTFLSLKLTFLRSPWCPPRAAER